MPVIMIITFTLLALTANVIWYKMKFILRDNDYDVSMFFSHFSDIPNMINLIKRTNDKADKKAYLGLLLGLFANIMLFAGLMVLALILKWI
jgi:hypothetical protein